MNKQYQGSKKKARRKAWEKRRVEKANSKPRISPIIQEMTMEEAAKEMGIKLK